MPPFYAQYDLITLCVCVCVCVWLVSFKLNKKYKICLQWKIFKIISIRLYCKKIFSCNLYFLLNVEAESISNELIRICCTCNIIIKISRLISDKEKFEFFLSNKKNILTNHFLKLEPNKYLRVAVPLSENPVWNSDLAWNNEQIVSSKRE